jgi:Zn-dependent protease
MDSTNIYESLQKIALVTPGFLLAITVHEFTHGYIAYRLGDPTAKLAGRLTFNPISHLDPFGTIILVLTQMIGWAKPVPVDPRYLRNPRGDMIWISLGGPAANLVTAAILAIPVHAMVFLTGGRVASGLAAAILQPLFGILLAAIQINVVLAVFNLIPIPPLDGSKILEGLLPLRYAYEFEKLAPYGPLALMVILMLDSMGYTHILSYVIMPPIRLILTVLIGG